MKLQQILNTTRTPHLRESIRLSHNKVIREAKEPQHGAYWWYPTPDGPDAIKWHIATYYNDDYDDTLHMFRWEDVLDTIALHWKKDPKLLKKHLDDNYTGLPRGRVERDTKDGKTIYILTHGADNPPGTSLADVLNAFNLNLVKRAGRLEVYETDHETMGISDTRRVQKVLKRNLGLTGKQEDMPPEDKKDVELWRSLHTLPSDQKKAAMKQLGLKTNTKKNEWQDAAEQAGIINPGQKWWAQTSEAKEPPEGQLP